MKILVDPIYTTNIRRCASAVKMKTIMNYCLEHNDDTAFYWRLPPESAMEEKDWEFLPKSDRVHYFHTSYEPKDRLIDYMTIDRELEMAVAFDGEYWDWDIVMTNRTTLTALIKLLSLKTSFHNLAWSRKVFLIEDMPIMSFKGYIKMSCLEAADTQALTGYLNADQTCISAYWEKAEILKIARRYLAPSQLRKLQGKITEATSVYVEKVHPKTKEAIVERLEGKRPFTISFSGRMTHKHRIKDIFDVMTKHWVMRGGDKLQCIMTTQSNSTGRVYPPEFIDVKYTDREEFWEVITKQSDIGVFMSKEEDYSMSLMEPILLGTPVAVYKAPHSVASLGEDYPFFFRTAQEAYGIIKAFYDDYPTLYKEFLTWQREVMLPIMQERNKDWLPYVFDRFLQTFREDKAKYFEAQSDKGMSSIAKLVQGELGPGEVTTLFDVLIRLGKAGKLDVLYDKVKRAPIRNKYRLSFSEEWKNHILDLEAQGVAEPYGVEVGGIRGLS